MIIKRYIITDAQNMDQNKEPVLHYSDSYAMNSSTIRSHDLHYVPISHKEKQYKGPWFKRAQSSRTL